ncbi:MULTISPECIES: ABC transporter ATP-binding protein [Brevibacterium]|uniref:Putative ABC transport system ATP-binding protein n=1 Tax=Brevibacterium antiquum CNRZ 918 TaxID=1255637 RepID=A0A2H1I6V4_9MICO|nr:MULTISPECIES: ABC transporter ATP-binding protein [Brevibacterium]SMX70844.1 putative ABC transport system ATP-binding protein [Brevibacterium antiquum CNRZ 918]
MTNTQLPAIITSSNITKHYNQTYALAGVDLTIGLGESLAIMGPSGSGKTTLLHCLAGIIRPDEGHIRLLPTERSAAAEITSLKEAGRTALRREVFGFVFQQGLLLPELTAVDNVALAAMLSGMKRPDATEHARAWLQRLGLGEHLSKRIGQLSGGQAQRVAIARAQVTQPVITFADEPTGALDSSTSTEVLTELLASKTGRGSTLVVVTHDESVAARCSRIVRLADGRVVSDSSNQQPSYQQPEPTRYEAPAQHVQNAQYAENNR